MKNIFSFLILCTICISIKADSIPKIFSSLSDSSIFFIKIKAIDLSEDAPPAATMNDEVFFFIYNQNGTYLPQNIFAQYFKLDTANRIKTFRIATPKILPTDTLTFILLEQDTEKQIKGIEPVCRIYLNEIYDNYLKNGTASFYEYFDDDDVLGMYRIIGSKFDLTKPIVKKFESLNLFDWAVYKMEISKTKF